MREALSPEVAQAEMEQLRIGTLETQCLIIDAARMDRNIARLRDRLAPMGVPLRPHLKTAKSVEVAMRAMPTPQAQQQFQRSRKLNFLPPLAFATLCMRSALPRVS